MVLNESIIRNIIAESLYNILSEKKVLRLKNSQPQQPISLMGGAPMDDPNAMGGDPSMGGDPMGGVPMDGSSMGSDPSMGGAPMDDPSMGGAPMDDPSMEDGGDDDDSTVAIINQLSDTDREAVRAYAESMLNRDETQNNNEDEVPPMDASMGQDNSGAPMMETVIFTKKQLRKINENFGPTADELNKDEKPLEKKKSKQVTSKSPFSAPKFK